MRPPSNSRAGAAGHRTWSERVWDHLPLDGQGLFAPNRSPLAELRRWAAARWWRAQSPWRRGVIAIASRGSWAFAVTLRAVRFGRRHQLARKVTMAVLRDCLHSGARPVEIFLWSECFPGRGRHPLPARAARILFSQLGDPHQQRTLTDKLATARVLDDAGIRTPVLHAHIPRGAAVDASAIVWRTPASLFIKPRHGSGGRGAFRMDVIGAGEYRLDNRIAGAESLMRRLSLAAVDDDIIVQEMLAARDDLRDLAAGERAPVLRLTTVHEPDSAPFLHSALLEVAVPGRVQHDFIHGNVHVPVNPRTGVLGSGVSLSAPRTQLARLPWNGASLSARTLDHFDEAVVIALRAMSLFPSVPIVTWDVMLPASGPVVLEGNSAANWILTNLPATQDFTTADLVPLLLQWRNARSLRVAAETPGNNRRR